MHRRESRGAFGARGQWIAARIVRRVRNGAATITCRQVSRAKRHRGHLGAFPEHLPFFGPGGRGWPTI